MCTIVVVHLQQFSDSPIMSSQDEEKWIWHELAMKIVSHTYDIVRHGSHVASRITFGSFCDSHCF